MVAMNVWPTDAADGSVASEARWRKMARHWSQTGALGGTGVHVSGPLAPSLAFPNLTVRSGACWVDGHFCELLSDQVLTVTANGLAVVRFDPAANTAELLYRDGVSTPAQSPTGVWELPIAQITGSALIDRRAQLATANGARGVVARAIKPTIDAGYAATEFLITGLNGLRGPIEPGRWLKARYGLTIVPPAATADGPAAPGITIRMRQGTGATGTIVGNNFHNWPENERGFDGQPNMFGEFMPSVPTPDLQYTLTFQSTGVSYSVGANSWFVLEDGGAAA